MSKTSKNLSWDSIRLQFPVAKNDAELAAFEKLAEAGSPIKCLQTACADGTLLAMIQKCADELHEGNTAPVWAALNNNWIRDKKCRMNGVAYHHDLLHDMKMLEILESFYRANAPKQPTATVKYAVAASANKPKWQYTIADIDALGDDLQAVIAVKNCLADIKKAEKRDRLDAYRSLAEHDAVIDHATKRINELKVGVSQANVKDTLRDAFGGKELSDEQLDAIIQKLTQLKSK